MTENIENDYDKSRKKFWYIYGAVVVVVVVVLVAFVAQDNEERLFFSLMTLAASYVMRPGDRFVNKMVLKLFSVSPPPKPDVEE